MKRLSRKTHVLKRRSDFSTSYRSNKCKRVGLHKISQLLREGDVAMARDPLLGSRSSCVFPPLFDMIRWLPQDQEAKATHWEPNTNDIDEKT